MTLRKQKAERKQQLVKNVEEMKKELAKVSKDGIEHQKNIFEIWFAFPKMVCFYPSSGLRVFAFCFFSSSFDLLKNIRIQKSCSLINHDQSAKVIAD